MKIPLYKVYTDEEDVEAVAKIVRRGTYWAGGPEIEEFERVVSSYIGSKFAVSFNSGTSALHALMLAYKFKERDEIVVPSFTFIATANAPLFVGATPIFADIEEETYGLDQEAVKQKINKKTKAIMPIHYGGLPCKDMKALKEIAEDHQLSIIEDSAESIGARINNEKTGGFGDASMISFCGNKVITTGEGGIALTKAKKISDRLKLIRSHGRLESEPYFKTTKTLDYVQIGYNWRISAITAALGISQMKKVDEVIDSRRRIANYLNERLTRIKEISLPHVPEGFHHVYQMYTIRVRSAVRNKLREFLSEKGVATKVYFAPVHLTHFYRRLFGFKGGELPATEKVANEVITLPIYPNMQTEEVEYAADCVRDFFLA